MPSAPAWDAILNGTSGALLIAGYIMIRQGRILAHKTFMLSAVACSTIFLVNYVVYHLRVGVHRFMGQGAIRPVYFTILISHIILSGVAVPLILGSFYLSLSGRYSLHRRVSKITFPIWLYVSVTGVVVFAFLKAYVH